MTNNYSPSVNILINEIDLHQYFVTQNVQGVFDAIVNNYPLGFRSVNLIGAYGTGKSSFLSAFGLHLSGSKIFFDRSKWSKNEQFEIFRAVGQYESLIEQFAALIGSANHNPAGLIREFKSVVKDLNKKKKTVVLLIDEFGKSLEFAAKHEPEKELYFLQQLAEFINGGENEVLLITTLHQDFSAYANDLSRVQRNEWSKVKGRFKEITFNEPVEQLLYLASKRLNSTVPLNIRADFEEQFNAVAEAKIYPLRDYFTKEVAEQLYPLDILSASILAISLQRYGQNERSLFTFLNGDSNYGLNEFKDTKASFYSVSNVYDYLNYNLYSFLNSKANPDYSKWAEIRNALEKVDGEFDFNKQSIYHVIVKTIGLFQIFLPGSAVIDQKFLTTYIAADKRYKNADLAIKELQNKFIIRYYHRTHKYTLHEASDVDIDLAINAAAAEVSMSNDIVKYLSTYFNFPTVSAKRAYFQFGTPRVFQFKISDNPYMSSIPEGEIDGYVNLVFNTYLDESDLIRISSETNEAILYGAYRNAEEIKSLIEEIEKAEIAREKYKEDRIAKRELDQIIDLQRSLLNHYVMHSFYNVKIVKWFYNGREIKIANNREFNTLLSDISRDVYPDNPIFKSELVNKSKLSPAISSARKELFKGLIGSYNVRDLGITGYPPQKSIYLSLLKETGIHRQETSGWVLSEPLFETDELNYAPLFRACNDFLESAKGAKRSVSDLYALLSKRPYKLKRGFLDFWIPVFLLIKRADYALYGEHGFISELDGEILELLVKRPQEYSVKAFDVAGIRIDLFNQYRQMLNLVETRQTSNEAFIQTVVPFIRFYKELHPYSKHTKRISKTTLQVRNALTEAKDPEKLFFEDFPFALGFDIIQLTKNPELLKQFTEALQNTIRELRSSYDELLNRFEIVINSIWNTNASFIEYKDRLRSRYQHSLKQYLLLPYQRTFYDRVCSPLEDRRAWLSSVAQSVVGKTLENISDKEELLLFERFIQLIHEMDNLNDMATTNVDLETEDIFTLEINAPGSGLNHQLIRMPKTKEKPYQLLKDKLSGFMEKEKRFTKIAILAELLKIELENKDGE